MVGPDADQLLEAVAAHGAGLVLVGSEDMECVSRSALVVFEIPEALKRLVSYPYSRQLHGRMVSKVFLAGRHAAVSCR